VSAALQRSAADIEARADALVREVWPTVSWLVEGEDT